MSLLQYFLLGHISVTLTREQNKIFGIRFKGSKILVPTSDAKTMPERIYVSGIQSGSVADREGSISVGDILLAINNQRVNEFEDFQSVIFAISNSGLSCTFIFDGRRGTLI